MDFKLGFWVSQRKLDFQGLKWTSWYLICPKLSPCQVSSLTMQDFSVNCSNGQQSIVLSKKSTVVNIQSNFKIFGQHQHFEVIFIIWSRVDHDSSRKSQNHQKSKVTKLGFSYGEVNGTLTNHNFHILHQKFLNQSSFWRKFNFVKLFLL